MRRLLVSLLAALPVCLLAPAQAAGSGNDDFLAPEAAFKTSAQVPDPATVELRFEVAPGYHLYRERITLGASSEAVPLAELVLPHGEMEFDAGMNRQTEILRGAVPLKVPVRGARGDFTLQVAYQGCADRGLCYPPQNGVVAVQVRDGGAIGARWLAEGELPPPAAAPAAAEAPAGRIESALRSGRLLTVAGVFLVAGLLLSFTPCVLPMLPILSSIIVGAGPVSRLRGFGLATAYSLGMALVYTALGVAAGLVGEGLAAALQNAWVLGAFALLLVALSLSMFGVYELQMPNAIQSRLNAGASRLPGGKHAGVFMMGGVSALIVGPCVAAPLAGALVFISQTRDVLIGGLALFSLAAGMSVPLLLVGVSAGSLLPRAGAWMVRVKQFFGVLLLAVAVWIVSPVLPSWSRQDEAALPFRSIRSTAELDAALRDSGGRPVMLDFYADWCVACKEMEHLTFSNAAVQGRMGRALLLRADVTANNADDKALLKRFGLFGPPGILFFEAAGREQAAARVIGFQPVAEFSRSLTAAGL